MRDAERVLTRRGFLTGGVLAVGGVVLVAARRGGRRAASLVAPVMAADVSIVQFSDAGVRLGLVKVPKVVKSENEWRKQLSPLAYEVAREGGTETPFTGAYWNVHDTGIFRCVCCGTALFSSAHKFDSGTGWPSFWQPIAPENIAGPRSWHPMAAEDSEVKCKRCDAHLGDMFDDGPPPTGRRYCIDSVSLRFVKAV